MIRNCHRFCLLSVLLLVPLAGTRAADEPATNEPVDDEQAVDTRVAAGRTIPSAGDHPGNVFLLGESVTVTLPAELAATPSSWRAVDDLGNEITRGDLAAAVPSRDRPMSLGKLGVGWYRVEWFDGDDNVVAWTTTAVLTRLAAATPTDSPICVDAAIAWFARDDVDRQARFAQLAALAGVNWTRDRLRWRDMQPTADELADESKRDTTYDTAAEAQAAAGLNVLQVFHDTPPWAVSPGGRRGRFPGDLRHVYRFGQAMGHRFAGKVQAWEPWNEANVADFGAHTIDEICAYQKAAYLGFKSGDAEATVCWNATTGVPTDRHTAAVLANETWPYFDTYNVHTYDWPTSYEQLWGPVRTAAGGKPIWVTESDRGMSVAENSPTRDITARNERLKAEFMAQSYALSLHAGAERHFHFILGQYGEREVQFGLLRHDLTPRPAYVALAAIGRLMAGARCLGRHVIADEPNVFIVAFTALPDGERRDVLVAWTERSGDWAQRGELRLDWPLPDSLTVERCFDYLGRPLGDVVPGGLTSAPTFVVLPAGEAARLTLESPTGNALRDDVASRGGNTPSPVVLQCHLPPQTAVRDESIRWAWEYEHRLAADTEQELPLYIYNFADHEVSGTVVVENMPPHLRLTPDHWQVSLAAHERRRLPAHVRVAHIDDTTPAADTWLTLRGEFGPAGRPVLAFELFAAPE